jgi:hypothetical protein
MTLRNRSIVSAGKQLDRWWGKLTGRYTPYRGKRYPKAGAVSSRRKSQAYARELGRRERALRRRVQRTPPAAAILGGGSPQLGSQPFRKKTY